MVATEGKKTNTMDSVAGDGGGSHHKLNLITIVPKGEKRCGKANCAEANEKLLNTTDAAVATLLDAGGRITCETGASDEIEISTVARNIFDMEKATTLSGVVGETEPITYTETLNVDVTLPTTDLNAAMVIKKDTVDYDVLKRVYVVEPEKKVDAIDSNVYVNNMDTYANLLMTGNHNMVTLGSTEYKEDMKTYAMVEEKVLRMVGVE